MNKQTKQPIEIEAIKAAQMAYETGQRCCTREDFSSSTSYFYYLKLMELGPCDFYEKFANEIDFDADFIVEYGGSGQMS